MYSIFTFLENTTSNSPKVSRVMFLGSDRLFCFTSICKFGSLKNPFAMITRLSELSLRFKRFILLVQTKQKSDFYELWHQDEQLKTIQLSETWPDTYDKGYKSITTWGTYTYIPTWTHSQNSRAAAEAPGLKISSHRTSLKWSQRLCQSAQE